MQAKSEYTSFRGTKEMYAEPVDYRINAMLDHKDRIFNLIEGKWSDNSIAMYIGSDTRTIKRFRRAYKHHGKGASDETIKSYASIK